MRFVLMLLTITVGSFLTSNAEAALFGRCGSKGGCHAKSACSSKCATAPSCNSVYAAPSSCAPVSNCAPIATGCSMPTVQSVAAACAPVIRKYVRVVRRAPASCCAPVATCAPINPCVRPVVRRYVVVKRRPAPPMPCYSSCQTYPSPSKHRCLGKRLRKNDMYF